MAIDIITEKPCIKVAVVTSQPSMWYNDKIGSFFEVFNTTDIYYQVKGEKHKIIFKCDVREINL